MGVFDTLSIPDDFIIQDLNVYVGINTNGWADCLQVVIRSPWNHPVFLANQSPNRMYGYLNDWFDTEDQEDGPGQLEDYNGYSSIGNWIIEASMPRCQNMYLSFYSWAIEVIGEPAGIKDEPNRPLQFGIISNYPNPFNDKINIQFGIAQPAYTTLDIYDILGRKVATLLDCDLQAAIHNVTWDACGMSSGIYRYILKSGDKKDIGKITLLK